MTEELKRFEKWWDAGDDIPNDGPYTPDTPIQFAWAGWQAALAQPAPYMAVSTDRMSVDPHTGYVSIGTVAQPAPVQEPVAWMTINGYGEEDDIHYENPEGHLLEGWTYKPLYTHPPQRPWVGLTDEEIQECLRGLPTQTIDVYARRIEAILEEKNT